MAAETVTAAERLHAYQAHHVIEPEAKVDVLTGDMIVCATDGIRIHPQAGYWFHDNEQVIALMDVLYGTPVERVLASMPDDMDEDEDDGWRNREGDPTLNGAFG